jgi:integrase
MVTGLRRGELAGLKWEDVDFLNLQINVTRSVVDQHVGKCKTEVSQKPVPIDEYIAADLVEWYRQTPYHAPTDWVFATDSNRAGAKRGKQPLWLCKVMGYHIQPISRKLGITKRIGWHTFRRTYSSILQDNGEDVKVVQELLRHASTKVTLDVYAQALTPTKRAAQRKVVQMIRGESRCTASVPREIGTSV